MKSPADVKRILRRQWESTDTRASRLLGDDAWPIEIAIGVPSPEAIVSRLDDVKGHVQRWRSVGVGEVMWSQHSYRATADPIALPVRWRLDRPTAWIAACDDRQISLEFETLSAIIGNCDPIFHELLVRRRSLWRDKPTCDVILAANVAMKLQPRCAEGRPLRTLSLPGTDTKFFERYERLVATLLDQRFDGEASRAGLEAFLNAASRSDHWLLVIDLDGSLLPFQKIRVRSSELLEQPLVSRNVLIVENETCGHLLPSLPSTIAVLGSGFDLGWTCATWLRERRVGYWGDMDTWGLMFLAHARSNIPHLTPLMMDGQVFDDHQAAAVSEPVPASEQPPCELTLGEQLLYKRLQSAAHGRLEQEYIAPNIVDQVVKAWAEE